MPDVTYQIACTVNGRAERGSVAARTTLADFLREHLGLTGTHLACEHGVCGACTAIVDGDAVRTCLMLAVQADGADITTIEGIAPEPGRLSPLQQAFADCHGLQCGFCTPGFIISMTSYLGENPHPSDDELRTALSGNLCRCTGYQGIVAAVRQAIEASA
jgi:carbon-monoxide dehydrogenase small subunit